MFDINTLIMPSNFITIALIEITHHLYVSGLELLVILLIYITVQNTLHPSKA